MNWSISTGIGFVVALFVLPALASAQEAESVSTVQERSGVSLQPASGETGDAVRESGPPMACIDEAPITLPKMTLVVLWIEETLGSKISTSGQIYDLALAEPVIVDEKVVLPAGLKGKGEVIHAKKAGGSGAAGELILAATYLDFEGRKIPLRSMKLGRTGDSNIGLATALGASPLGPLGMLVSGKNTQIEAGTVAEAKLAKDFQVPDSGNSVSEKAPCIKGGTQ